MGSVLFHVNSCVVSSFQYFIQSSCVTSCVCSKPINRTQPMHAILLYVYGAMFYADNHSSCVCGSELLQNTGDLGFHTVLNSSYADTQSAGGATSARLMCCSHYVLYIDMESVSQLSSTLFKKLEATTEHF